MAARGTIEVVVPRRPTNGSNSTQLSVDEALQYTPMTTSPLTAGDRIPIPQLNRPNNVRLTSSADRQAVYRSELYTPKVKDRLAALLDPSRLSEIKFKRPPVQDAGANKIDLNPVSKMVLRMTKIDYIHPTTDRQPSSAKKTTPRKQLAKNNSTGIVVEIPKPHPSFNQNDYVAIADSPKGRKMGDSQVNGKLAVARSSKKEKDDLLLANFENQLIDLFEAQDRLAPDTSASPSKADTGMFEIKDEDDDVQLRLAVPVQEKLQSVMSSLLSAGRLGDASSEYLQRLQRLCEPAIEAAQVTNLRVMGDPSEDDISNWLLNIRKVSNGAASACTLIYTVLGAPHNEELINLEALQWLPNVLVNVFENCLIPIVESRPEGSDGKLFEHAAAHGEILRKLLDIGRKLLDLVARVCVDIKGAGSIVNATEFLASKLIFVQNAYNDKMSAIGSQAYERLRKQAMAGLAKLYAAFPAERAAILDEVLTSLDKLPSNSRSARQFKLGSGKSIQLISALFMQLVQTPALQTGKKERRSKQLRRRNRSPNSESSEEDDDSDDMDVDSTAALEDDQDPILKLDHAAKVLFDDAFRSAQQIVMWMVDKASKVTKTGDSPYRNILDLFVEDLTVVLPSTEWPASELLLTVLALRMVTLAKNDRAASTKNMALESLGVMGSAISVTRASARSLLASIVRDGEANSSEIAQSLSTLVQDQTHFLLRNEDLVLPEGPFAIVHSYLDSHGSDSLRTKSAKAYFLVQYATLLARTLKETRDKGGLDFETDLKLNATVSAMSQQLSTPDGYNEMANDHLTVTAQEAQVAYTLSILNGQFCRRFPDIAKTLASSLSSDQAQVRSRSLKSVVTILETDSSLLDWDPTIADDVFRCASDDSSLVRDSALSLIAKFILPKPALEEKAFRRLLKCAGDANVGVQKRAMGHLRDVYMKESRQNMKATIATEFLRRTVDQESSVAELAKRTLTDIWLVPKLTLLNEGESAHADVAIEELKTHIVACVANDTAALAPLLKGFLAWRLKDLKNLEQVRELYARIVKKLLDTANSAEAGEADLTTLVAFAEARPQTVVPSDLTSLKSYLKDLSNDDLLKFRSVVAIFRSVLPHLSSTQAPLLQEVQLDLMKAAQRLGNRHELEEVMSCLRSIDGVLHNTGRFVAFTRSIMQNVLQPKLAPQLRDQLIRDNQQDQIEMRENRMREKSLRLAGVVAKHINLEGYRKNFQADFPSFKSGSVAGFIADCIVPFTFKKSSIEIRLKALESLGLICQAWPGQFNKQHVRETFFQVLDGSSFASLDAADVLKLQITVLEIFEELYATRAASVKEESKKGEGDTEVQALKNIGGDSKTREDDSAISIITNPLVDHLLRIVTTETGQKALLAAQTLASIDHQGMTHPKQSTSAFVSLETSTDARVASVAKAAHEHLHQQHESVCEREYINAVYGAFRYQNEVFKDPQGGVVPGFKAKLAAGFAIISGSGSKYVKKFLSSLISKLNTEVSKLAMGEDDLPEHLLFVLFVTQNLAFFEYKKMDELLHTVLQLELAFGKNGGETAQAIESNLPPTPVAPVEVNHVEVNGDGEPVPTEIITPEPAIDAAVLKRLTTAACAITLISEARNFLKRQYGISRDVKMAMQQNKQTKDAGKEPVKVHGITGDRFWNSTNAVLDSFASHEAMVARCREFVGLVAVDDEVKIAEEEGEMLGVELVPEAPMSAPRGRKRKSINGSVGGTPKKPRGRPPKNANGRRSTSISSLEDDPDGDFDG